MSYGCQGPPGGQNQGQPPASFGVPPGTPFAPGAAPCVGFTPPPSFRMPQSETSYPVAPYPNVVQMPQPSQFTGPVGFQSSPYSNSPRPANSSQYPANNMNQSYEAKPSMPQGWSHGSAHQYQGANSAPLSSGSYLGGQGNAGNLSTNYGYGSSMTTSHGCSAPLMSEHQYPGANAAPHQGQNYHGGQGNAGHYSTHRGSGSSMNAVYCAPGNQVSTVSPKTSPTVVTHAGFNARVDAEALRTAMKGFGTDEKTIINILANRTNLQRQEIVQQFKTLYGKDMLKNLKSELSGNFENLIIAMVTPLPQYYASELCNAMARLGTKDHVLIEIFCSLPNHEIRGIKNAYHTMYARPLEEDLRSDTSGHFKRLMVSLCAANRDESCNVDHASAQADARALQNAGVGRLGTDESAFNAVLASRSFAQLKQVFVEYRNLCGHDIEHAIKEEFSGDIEKGLLAIVKCVKDKPAFFAEQLFKSMKGLGTQDRRLIRLVVTRSEIDLGEIKHAFKTHYGQSLENFISDDCSGDYRKCLLALVA